MRGQAAAHPIWMSLEGTLSVRLLDVGLRCIRADTDDLIRVLLRLFLVHVRGAVAGVEGQRSRCKQVYGLD